MLPVWWTVKPTTRRLLVFETHRWVVERVIAPIAKGDNPAVEGPWREGRLAVALREIVADDADEWSYWIRLVLGDLRHALALSGGQPDEAWARRLFRIPYSVPMRRRPCRQLPNGP